MSRLLFVSSVGGHLTELLAMQEWMMGHDCLFVVNGRTQLPRGTKGVLKSIPHRTSFGIALSFFELLPHFWRFRPDGLITNGAGHGVAAAVAARLFGIPVVYIETGASIVMPSLTGRLISRLRLSDFTVIPWEQLRDEFPDAECTGPLF